LFSHAEEVFVSAAKVSSQDYLNVNPGLSLNFENGANA
jgi:hypothetical protein